MASSLLILLTLTACLSSFSVQASAHQQRGIQAAQWNVVGQRVFSFTETPEGSNITFECSRSGPCVPCLYSEKNDDKYRCSETGYRIPFKCVEAEGGGSKDSNDHKTRGRSTVEISDNSVEPHVVLMKHRSLLDDSSTEKVKSQAYITYRSCLLTVNEEKLTVLGFEGLLFGVLLISGSVVYLRRKRTVTMPGIGTGRIPSNSRF